MATQRDRAPHRPNADGSYMSVFTDRNLPQSAQQLDNDSEDAAADEPQPTVDNQCNLETQRNTTSHAEISYNNEGSESRAHNEGANPPHRPEELAAQLITPASNVINALTARDVVPDSFAQAKEILRFGFLDNSTSKALLKALKITGLHKAKVVTKQKIIAMKMTQGHFSLNDALDYLELVEQNEDNNSHFLRTLLPSTVKVNKSTTGGLEEITWLRGDVPVFNGDEINKGEPSTNNGDSISLPTRQSDFEASEDCRLLHTLADTRMTLARAQLIEPRTRNELDREPFDPWTDHIAPLFNYVSFQPGAISSLSGGVTRADISTIDPSTRLYKRPAGVLKRKFGEFKSLYGTIISKHESSGQGDPDGFVYHAKAKTYIMYAFCFLKANPLLQPLATRALQSDAQREEGVGDGVCPGPESAYGYGRKRKRETQDVNILGMEGLSSIFRPLSDEVARESEEAERDKMKYEAAEAKGKSAQSLLTAIRQANEMVNAASDDQERALYAETVEKLMHNLFSSLG